jgi:SAM-dependent methyltransferase
MPLANSLLMTGALQDMEPHFALKVFVCDGCHLVQLPALETPEHIFGRYLYYSSFSKSWLSHCQRFAADAVDRFGLTAESEVIEIASNDGYLLQFFQAYNLPVLGIEPARNVAEAAIAKGIPTEIAFFGTAMAQRLREQGHRPALVPANNVLAHVPDINDFVAGLSLLLQPEGVLSLEFPSLLNLIQQRQFDTIYHEHYSYLCLLTTERILRQHGLRVMDVEELPTHGGSLRVYACPQDASHRTSAQVGSLRQKEVAAGLDCLDTYRDLSHHMVEVKCSVLEFLIQARRAGKSVVGYGAPAKGNTLLNYCGVGPELLPFTVDLNPHKQGLWLPGSRIPVRAPEAIFEARPDYLFILPWNLEDEIIRQMDGIRAWNGKFVIPIPELRVFDGVRSRDRA